MSADFITIRLPGGLIASLDVESRRWDSEDEGRAALLNATFGPDWRQPFEDMSIGITHENVAEAAAIALDGIVVDHFETDLPLDVVQ